MVEEITREVISGKLDLLVESFQKVLYEDDETFLEGMKDKNLSGCDISRFRHWEWTQGVGLFGLWKLFETTGDKRYLDMLTKYYDASLENGLPTKNVNTTAPMLALSYLASYTGNEAYYGACLEWAGWLVAKLPKTKEGGFQHLTSDTLNDQELWDDTLFMAVLFLANMGRYENNTAWIEEAKYQFLIHIKYLADRKSGLWFHGWTFKGSHNFVEALWGRGNSWATAAIPEFLSIIGCEGSVRRFLVEALRRQAEALKLYQDEGGMWHTLVDDSTSYVEASATCGFGYGMLAAVRMGLIDGQYRECAMKALIPILELIDGDGILHQVSYGTAMGRYSRQFYKDIEIKTMPYGQAMAILFLLEVSKIINKEDVL